MKRMMSIISGVAICATLAVSSASAETQTAKAVVVNKTGKDIVSVSLSHKYSDNFKDQETWVKLIKNGETTPRMTVTYNEGFLTTGKSWWAVNFVHPSTTPVLNYSDPTNFRGFIDGLEQFGGIAIPAVITGAVAAAGVACSVSTAGACTPAGVGGTAAAAAAGTALTAAMINSESTSGFKQHILSGEDADQLVTITLFPGGKIEISSPSGKSTTKYSSKSVDVDPDVQALVNKALAKARPSGNSVVFTRIPGAAISGHNTLRLNNASVSACEQACAAEVGFFCKSFDYYVGQNACDLSDKSASEVGGLKTDYAGNPYDHYARQ